MTRATAPKVAKMCAVAGAGSTAPGTPPLRDVGGKTRHSYAFRRDVVGLVTIERKNIGEIAAAVGIARETLQGWVREFRDGK